MKRYPPRILVYVATFVSIAAALFSPQTAHAWTVDTILGISVSGGAGATPFASLMDQILNLLYGISGGCALIMIVLGGYRYMGAQGDQKRVEEAKSTIQSAIYGLVLILLAYTFAQAIGGESLTNFNI